MTLVKIIQEFRDKDRFSKIYLVGDICEFDENRALSLISKGLAELIFEKMTTSPKEEEKH